MINPNIKGKRGERDVKNRINLFLKENGYEAIIKRNFKQWAEGGCDLEGLDFLSIEVKRQERLNLKGWWSQTLRQTEDGQIPVLVFKQNHKAWQVMLQAEVRGVSSVGIFPFETLLELIYRELAFRIKLNTV